MGELFSRHPGNAAGVIRDPESLEMQAKPLDSGSRLLRRLGRNDGVGMFTIYATLNSSL